MPFLYNDPKRKNRRQDLRRQATTPEYYFWSFLWKTQFENLKFRRQYGVGPYILDFYCPELRFGIELDGESHDSQQAQRYDHQRTKYLQSLNISIIRFQNADVLENTDCILAELRKYIRARRAHFFLPPSPSYN